MQVKLKRLSAFVLAVIISISYMNYSVHAEERPLNEQTGENKTQELDKLTLPAEDSTETENTEKGEASESVESIPEDVGVSMETSEEEDLDALSETLPVADEAGMIIDKAVIRDDAGDEQNLLEQGDAPFTVDYAKQVTLHIKVKSQLNLKNKKIEIKVPDGLAVVEYPKPNSMTGLVESVAPEDIKDLKSDKNYGGYQPKSGTITYSLRDTAENSSFNIILTPDTTLWNKKLNSEIKEPLKVRLYSKSEDGNPEKEYQTVSKKAKIIGENLKSGPVFTSWDSKRVVPTKAHTPFKMQQIRFRSDRNRYGMGMFFKKLEITIALPYNKNKQEYATYVRTDFDKEEYGNNWMDPAGHEAEEGFSFTETTNNDRHTVTLTWKNLYIPRDDYFTPYFKWQQECNENDIIEWRNENIELCAENGQNPTTANKVAVGGEILYADDSSEKIKNNNFANSNLDTFKAISKSDMTIKGAQVGSGISGAQGLLSLFESNPDMVYFLGQFQVANKGTDESVPQTVTFSYQGDGKIGVTAQRIPASSGNKVEIWYTTTNNNIEEKYQGDLTSRNGFVQFTAKMAGLDKDEYFTNIRAEVGSYNANYMGYVESRTADPSSSCAATFGKVLKRIEPETKISNLAEMTMKNKTGTEEDISGAFDLNIADPVKGNKSALALLNKLDDDGKKIPILDIYSTIAGNEVKFNGVIATSAYPYTLHKMVDDTEVYIRLPQSVAVEDLKLSKIEGSTADRILLGDTALENGTTEETSLTEGEDYTIVKSKDNEDGSYVLHKITFKNNSGMIGWYNEDLGQLQIGLSFTMKIDNSADAMTLDMRDCVRVKSASLTAYDSATLGEYCKEDTYDMNGNGNVQEKFTTFNVNAPDTKLSVVASRLGLTFGFGAKLSDNKGAAGDGEYINYDTDKRVVFLKKEDHGIDLRFTAKNETGREFDEEDAKAFYYYIPVPKKGDNWDTHIQDKAFEFNMKMTGPATIGKGNGSDLQVTYSTTVDSSKKVGEEGHYNNPNVYKSAEEITKEGAWSQVKMLRISAKDSVNCISMDASETIDIHYEVDREDETQEVGALVGSIINFGPCGYSPYAVGNELNGGHMPLPHIQAEFQTGVIAGKIFIDKNYNGIYDQDTDELYTGKVTIKAPHQNAVGSDDHETHETTAENGTFQFTGRRADTYQVTVINPGSSDANGKNPLKFSLEEQGKFQEAEGENAVRAEITVSKGNAEDNKNLTIGLQKPHTVKFEAINATVNKEATNVWHKETLTDIPKVTENAGYRFDGNWIKKNSANMVYTSEQLKDLKITDNCTFIAQVNELYDVTYDGNSNTDGDVPQGIKKIKGDKFKLTYTGTGKLKRNGETFAGWSLKKREEALPADASKQDIDEAAIISGDSEFTMPEQNVTFYAVWAVDKNQNGIPDCSEDAVHVRYHDNAEDTVDVICPDHHVVGAEVELSTIETAKNGISGRVVQHGKDPEPNLAITSHKFENGGNILIGWSEQTFPTIVKTKKDFDSIQKDMRTKVTMGNKGADVYAVWAADRNNNGTADYLEEHTLTYNENAQENGSVSQMPSESNVYLRGDKVTLSQDIPQHTKVNNKEVVFLGWTEEQTTFIYERDNEEPKTITEVTFAANNIDVYAAWGYDEDGDGTADVLETYSLKYDLNGGSGNAPKEESGIEKGTTKSLTTEKNFTRKDNEVFVGWSRTQHQEAFTAEQKDEVNKVLITGKQIIMKAEDITLYAVWAVDRNGNDKPDYEEVRSKLIYDSNAQQGGTVQNMPSDDKKYLPKEKVNLKDASEPIYKDADGKRVVFLGWTTTKNDKIYRWNDDEPKTTTEITFEEENITVYAAWGYDEDGDNLADVWEEWGVVSYDLNGGTTSDANEKYDEEIIKIGERFTVKASPIKKGYTFIGWKYKGKIYQPGEQLVMKADLTKAQAASLKLTAQWGGGDLTVSNKVEGDEADEKKDFHFRVKLKGAKIDGTLGDMNFKNGVSDEFTLKHGESKTAVNLPLETEYEVVETDENQDGYVTTSTGEKGKITANGKTAEFVNTRNNMPTVPVGDLSISTAVTGNQGDKSKGFTFTVTLNDKTITGTFGDMKFRKGVANITLKHGESVTGKGLLAGISYAVEETGNEGYLVTKSGETGVIEDGKTAFVKFLNYRNSGTSDEDKRMMSRNLYRIKQGEGKPSGSTGEIPKSGDESNVLLWLLLAGVSNVGAGFALAVSRRKKYNG